MLPVYARPPDIVMHRGEGSYLFAQSGLKYLDFSAGIAVNALGHGDERFLQVRARVCGASVNYLLSGCGVGPGKAGAKSNPLE